MADQTPLGREVLNIPFGEIIREVATGIAEAQFDLDKTSMLVAELMSGQQVLRDPNTGIPILKDGEPQIINSTIQFGHSYQSIGEGATAEAVLGEGKVTEIIVTNPGSGYIGKPAVTISGGTNGVNAIANVTMTGERRNKVSRVTLVSGGGVPKGGSGYSSNPIVTFEDPPEVRPASADAVLVDGSVDRIDIDDKGSGFKSVPNVRIIGGGGTGAIAAATLEFDSQDGVHIASITVINGGSGYDSIPRVILDDPEPGVTAAATAVIRAKVANIITTNPGSGYEKNTLPEVKLIGGGGTGATSAGQLNGDAKGGLMAILTNAGSNYTEPPRVEIISKFRVVPNEVSMMELGFAPNFYQFVDTVIDMKLALRINKTSDNKFKISAATVDANYASSYNYNMAFSSRIKTKIVPIPPPIMLEERLRQILSQREFIGENKDRVVNPPSKEPES